MGSEKKVAAAAERARPWQTEQAERRKEET